MNQFRIYYRLIGVITKKNDMMTIIADSAEEAIEFFKAHRSCAKIVAIFAD